MSGKKARRESFLAIHLAEMRKTTLWSFSLSMHKEQSFFLPPKFLRKFTSLHGVLVTESILPPGCQHVHLNPSSKWLDDTWSGAVNLVNAHDSTIVCRDKTLQRIGWRDSYNSCMQNHMDQAAWTCLSKIDLESTYCCYLCYLHCG